MGVFNSISLWWADRVSAYLLMTETEQWLVCMVALLLLGRFFDGLKRDKLRREIRSLDAKIFQIRRQL